MVLKLSFIMSCPSENFVSSLSTSHHCYTEERNVAHEEICVCGFRFLQERHSFLLKVRPTNLQTHIDKLSIEIQSC